MRMNTKIKYVLSLLVTVFLLGSSESMAMTAEELQQRIVDGTAPVIIDIRRQQSYRAAHIPGAISIPAVVVERKTLQGFGPVVVYGDGIDQAATLDAVAALNRKSGVTAEILEGGILAWKSIARGDSRAAGLHSPGMTFVSYQQVLDMSGKIDTLVLVDVRSPGKFANDLSVDFNGARVITPPPGIWARHGAKEIKDHQLIRRRDLVANALYVLVDDGNGRRAEAIAWRLQGSGIRAVVLLGGAEIVVRKGILDEKSKTTRTININ